MPRKSPAAPTICFVTGTRAEFGLMESTLKAIQSQPNLRLRVVVTGMHLDKGRGGSLEQVRRSGIGVDLVIPWKVQTDATSVAQATGLAITRLAKAYERLRVDVVLIVGDRPEAFAAAAAAHLAGRLVAHVHGGDRALGQVDDALRHAITKLSHIHFPATKQSAERIRRLGEQSWRIHTVGSPGIDGIQSAAAPWPELLKAVPGLHKRHYALLVLHPAAAHEKTEFRRAELILAAIRAAQIDRTVIIYPNNDPGSGGIVRCWRRHEHDDDLLIRRDLSRAQFLGLLRHAALVVGNSSSGIIEAASFRTPVIDIGPRQQGRQRGPNVAWCDYHQRQIARALTHIWRNGKPTRAPAGNVYGAGNTARRIATLLSNLPLCEKLRQKMIAY